MCGIFGSFATVQQDRDLFESSLDLLSHRGPDDAGSVELTLSNGTLLLGHRRLSILDLTSNGRQPMTSLSGNTTVIFNGEIYNYKELRSSLIAKGYSFRTNSDTEVLVNAWEEWGKNSLRRLNGMFSFAVFERKTEKLSIVRDAFGIKPLFYLVRDEQLIFSSEISAIRRFCPNLESINLAVAYQYLVHGVYDFSSSCFFEGIQQVEPATLVEFNCRSGMIFGREKWWKPDLTKENQWDFAEACREIRTQLLENVKLHLRSDVPVGFALSGGIDSSAIIGLAKMVEPDLDMRAFSFSTGNFDSEIGLAKMVASQVDSKIIEIEIGDGETLADLVELVRVQGEPFGSSSIYAQSRVYRAAKENGVTVILEGQGGDEIFGGYHGYAGFRAISQVNRGKYWAALKFLVNWRASGARKLSEAVLDALRYYLASPYYEYVRKLNGRSARPNWIARDMLAGGNVEYVEYRHSRNDELKTRAVIEELYSSINMRGLPALLRHADRNSMSYSIESRVPFLTTDLCELAFALPENFLISNQGITKSILRAAMNNIVPDEILTRSDKIGFATPQFQWMNNNRNSIIESIMEWASMEDFIITDSMYSYLMCKSPADFSQNSIWRLLNFSIWRSTFFQK